MDTKPIKVDRWIADNVLYKSEAEAKRAIAARTIEAFFGDRYIRLNAESILDYWDDLKRLVEDIKNGK